MWAVILASVGILATGGAVYLLFRFHKFSFVQKIAEKSRALSWLAAALPLALCTLFLLFNLYAFVIVIVHLVLFFLLFDLVFFIIRRARARIGKKKENEKEKKISFDVQGFTALAVCALYLGVGFFSAFHVFRTEYALKSDKSLDGALRIVMIADAHIGVTLDGERFAEQTERISAEKPDVVCVVGDFVDDDSKKEDMLRAVRALGEIDAKYGVYIVEGNHDRGYFRYRDFSESELRKALTDNGVKLLEDETLLVGDRFYIIGRKDRSMRDRTDASTLVEGLDRSKYMIMLDHQPNDYQAEEEAGVDLVLSGHTHGGHIFPAGLIGMWIGANDKLYGRETRGSTDFIVTSGISGWAIPIKTLCFSEYVVIDVNA